MGIQYVLFADYLCVLWESFPSHLCVAWDGNGSQTFITKFIMCRKGTTIISFLQIFISIGNYLPTKSLF